MRIARTFVWGDGRPDEGDEIRSSKVFHRVSHDGALFVLRRWDIRYRPGERRVTEAIYDELQPAGVMLFAPDAVGSAIPT